jgi:hypothetical protein
MHVRPLVGALLLTFSLGACDSPLLSTSCSSASDVNPAGAALTDDIQKAEAAGKIDRARAAEAMGRVMSAAQTYDTKRDAKAFCGEIAKIRKDVGL